MKYQSRSELVRLALDGDGNAVEKLHDECIDQKSAKEVSDLLLGTLPQHQATVEDWLHAIVELHPDLAVLIGAGLKSKLGLRLDLEKDP